ncbi:hypothetical protein BC941DRAFT_437408 [Chlamydoabsidia padenii]|nr:hypothetical protein BC941DRAFT_437408 [Chlamydoabsidia padenii]
MANTRQEIKDSLPNPEVALAFDGVFSEHVYDNPLLKNSNVYPDLHATLTDWEPTIPQNAQPYLPLQDQDPVNVVLGIQQLTTVNLPVFGSTCLGKHMKYKHGYVINTGGSVCGLDFAPKTSIFDTQPMIQYLATGGYKEPNVLCGFETPRQGNPNCIQLWKLNLATTEQEESPVLDLVLLHDYGDVRDLRWCPYGAYEETTTNDSEDLPKLGILAGCFGDGTVRCFVIPHPNTLRVRLGVDAGNQDPVYLKIKQARCVFALPNTSISTISWGGHKKLAIGSSTGYISIWNMASALTSEQAMNQQQSIRFMIFNAPIHDAGVQSIVWHGIDDPVNLISTGNDGKFIGLDIRDPFIPITFSRQRAIQYDAMWSGHRNKIMFVDGDLILKEFFSQDCKNFKSGNVNAAGTFMSMACSEQHSFIVLGSSDGFLKLVNTLIKRVKGKAKLQKILYKLIYNEKDNVYRYVDGLQPQSVDDTKAMSPANTALDYNITINRVKRKGGGEVDKNVY